MARGERAYTRSFWCLQAIVVAVEPCIMPPSLAHHTPYPRQRVAVRYAGQLDEQLELVYTPGNLSTSEKYFTIVRQVLTEVHVTRKPPSFI